MINSGFIDRLGEENVCPHIAAALARAREILGLPPVKEDAVDQLAAVQAERAKIEVVRKELAESLQRAQQLLGHSADKKS
jgi:SulP family sulfate permease